jgi:hypothetical protein
MAWNVELLARWIISLSLKPGTNVPSRQVNSAAKQASNAASHSIGLKLPTTLFLIFAIS